ncbi:hypothetical protein BZG36_01617 [Bifiguratus adelaidae]|uniref:C3H1-type domain-containing protein n=1 Tax=Bifiguratus adelaidae TaxID=1938954 RepID=A0A261Y4E3_9FUNG|nr:hypothetical protein BZG36_01617 [Bifiguratus adelaidae]
MPAPPLSTDSETLIKANPQLLPFNDVNSGNLASLYPAIKLILQNADFIAIDTEFSGLGGGSYDTKAPNLDQRYKGLVQLAKDHALVALGLTAFSKKKNASQEEDNAQQWIAHNFNILLKPMREYRVDPRSLQFLSESGFDFNRQIRDGVQYMPGDWPRVDQKSAGLVEKENQENASMQFGRAKSTERTPAYTKPSHEASLIRSLVRHISRLSIPIITHNGFLDLIFIYDAFFASPPEKLQTFVADLTDIFPGGIYDTKYVAEYMSREGATFLSYLYRKYERQQARLTLNDKQRFDIEVKSPFNFNKDRAKKISNDGGEGNDSTQDSRSKSKRRKTESSSRPYCSHFATHGHCKYNKKCGKSHDLDLILDEEEKEEAQKKRKTDSMSESQLSTQETLNEHPQMHPTPSTIVQPVALDAAPPTLFPSTDSVPTLPRAPVPSAQSYHSAHFDSYMTGYIFLHQSLKLFSVDEMTTEARNRIYLMGKDIPLRLQKSMYTTISKNWAQAKQDMGIL